MRTDSKKDFQDTRPSLGPPALVAASSIRKGCADMLLPNPALEIRDRPETLGHMADLCLVRVKRPRPIFLVQREPMGRIHHAIHVGVKAGTSPVSGTPEEERSRGERKPGYCSLLRLAYRQARLRDPVSLNQQVASRVRSCWDEYLFVTN